MESSIALRMSSSSAEVGMLVVEGGNVFPPMEEEAIDSVAITKASPPNLPYGTVIRACLPSGSVTEKVSPPRSPGGMVTYRCGEACLKADAATSKESPARM